MNRFAKFVVLALLGLVVVYYSAYPQSAPVKAGLTLENFLGALGGLFVLVLLIERATEIFIAVSRNQKTESLKAQVATLAADTTKSVDHAAKASELAEYQNETKGLALLTGFSISIIACAGGIGILKTIVDTTSGADPHFIRGIDILLTSGLLAGGSDSFHQFVRALETFFQNANKKDPK
jgi:hypothetical protein